MSLVLVRAPIPGRALVVPISAGAFRPAFIAAFAATLVVRPTPVYFSAVPFLPVIASVTAVLIALRRPIATGAAVVVLVPETAALVTVTILAAFTVIVILEATIVVTVATGTVRAAAALIPIVLPLEASVLVALASDAPRRFARAIVPTHSAVVVIVPLRLAAAAGIAVLAMIIVAGEAAVLIAVAVLKLSVHCVLLSRLVVTRRGLACLRLRLAFGF
ncbi:MAG TPA: hypothetical protein VHA70_00560 [Bauldia sp.]|nr:hypothetical protein [Bauldia sp.]